MHELTGDTMSLIHATTEVKAIKRLVTAHDILEMNLEIEARFPEVFPKPWELGAFRELDLIRVELITSFSDAFKPVTLIPPYYEKMGFLFRLLKLG